MLFDCVLQCNVARKRRSSRLARRACRARPRKWRCRSTFLGCTTEWVARGAGKWVTKVCDTNELLAFALGAADSQARRDRPPLSTFKT